MSQSPRVSVVVATFNGAEHITEQLTSIAAQTLAPLEIIVTDDCSEDTTVDLVREFARGSAIPVRLTVNPQQLGYPENFLRAAQRAGGDLIAFSDQDDVWLPEKLSCAAVAFADPSLMLWVHDSRVVDEELNVYPDKRFHTGFAKRAARADPFHPLHGSHSVFRAEVLRYLPPDERPASVYGEHPAEHDEWIKFAALVLGRVAREPKPLMLYRRHGGALTRSAPLLGRAQVLRGLDESRHGYAVRAAYERCAYLKRRLAAPECAAVRPELKAAVQRYEQLVPRLTRRVRTRQSDRALNRVSSLLAAAFHGDYRSIDRGGLGCWALLQDLYTVWARAGRPAGSGG